MSYPTPQQGTPQGQLPVPAAPLPTWPTPGAAEPYRGYAAMQPAQFQQPIIVMAAPKPGPGLAIGGLSAGGLALLLAIVPFTSSLSVLPVLTGLALSIISLVRNSAGTGMAVTGIVLSCAAVLAPIGWISIGFLVIETQFLFDL